MSKLDSVWIGKGVVQLFQEVLTADERLIFRKRDRKRRVAGHMWFLSTYRQRRQVCKRLEGWSKGILGNIPGKRSGEVNVGFIV